MQLTDKQIANIKQRITLSDNKEIVRINVAGDKTVPTDEKLFNIYCVDENYQIIWQVREIGTTPVHKYDCFAVTTRTPLVVNLSS